jgi:hypothetical protein
MQTVSRDNAIEVTQSCGHATRLSGSDLEPGALLDDGLRCWYLAQPPRDRDYVKRLISLREMEICKNCQQSNRAAAETLRAECETGGIPCFIRFGAVPENGCSWNSRDGIAEPGVSVYPGWKLSGRRYVADLRDCCFSAMWLWDRPAYIVTGDVLDERGSDGEPLIANATARKLPHAATVECLT